MRLTTMGAKGEILSSEHVSGNPPGIAQDWPMAFLPSKYSPLRSPCLSSIKENVKQEIDVYCGRWRDDHSDTRSVKPSKDCDQKPDSALSQTDWRPWMDEAAVATGGQCTVQPLLSSNVEQILYQAVVTGTEGEDRVTMPLTFHILVSRKSS